MSWVRKAQVSMEYLLVIGFVSISLIPLIYVYYTFTKDSGDEVVMSQLSAISKEIVGTAESVYYLGAPSQKTLKVYIPSQVIRSEIQDQEIRFVMQSREIQIEVSEYSEVNITGAVPNSSGNYQIIVRAQGDFVNVSYT